MLTERDLKKSKMKEDIHYLVELLGDLSGTHLFHSLGDALDFLKGTIGYPDPEDDRILIWEVLPSGHRKVVWHFSGWHWNADEFGIPQGKYPGFTESVYCMCMRNFDIDPLH